MYIVQKRIIQELIKYFQKSLLGKNLHATIQLVIEDFLLQKYNTIFFK